MDDKILTWIQDINFAIEEIKDFLPDPPEFEYFKNDRKTIRAVERNLEIIGEAVNRIKKLEPEISISDAQKIIDTRNRIIHGYDTVSVDILWSIVTKSLPILKGDLSRLKEG